MPSRTFSPLRLCCLQVLFAQVLVFAAMAPLPKGPFAVGSTNMEVPEMPAKRLLEYFNGSTGKSGVYIADLFPHPETALKTTLQIPDNRKAYGSLAGTSMPLVLYVLYPTTNDNPRPDYKLPYSETGDSVFPHMQRPGEKPVFADGKTRYPVIFYSTGYNAHGLWDLHHLKFLATHGYIVVSIFHGDSRVSFWDGFGLRPLQLKHSIDFLLSHPDFGPAIDPERIGVSGSSFGGYTCLASMGGKYLRSVDCTADPRIKAGFGLVPFVGATMRWPFGKDFSGLKTVQTPFFAIYAEKDKSVRRDTVEAAFAQLPGTASAVLLEGEEHLLTDKVWSDVFTWEVLYFNAWLKGDPEARKLVYGETSVTGGGVDKKTIQRIKD